MTFYDRVMDNLDTIRSNTKEKFIFGIKSLELDIGKGKGIDRSEIDLDGMQ